jgi:tetratricopeptide (TPR) repeat protein
LADHDHDESGISQAFSDADRGIQLAPEYPEAYQVRAFLRGAHNLDMVGAEADVQRALSLDPTNSLVLTSYAQILAARGNVVDAIAAAQRALSTIPCNSLPGAILDPIFWRWEIMRWHGKSPSTCDRSILNRSTSRR